MEDRVEKIRKEWFGEAPKGLTCADCQNDVEYLLSRIAELEAGTEEAINILNTVSDEGFESIVNCAKDVVEYFNSEQRKKDFTMDENLALIRQLKPIFEVYQWWQDYCDCKGLIKKNPKVTRGEMRERDQRAWLAVKDAIKEGL